MLRWIRSSKEAEELLKLRGISCGRYGDYSRDDPNLVSVVEELGEAADGVCAMLKVIEIPEGIEWEISDYDGMEEGRHRVRILQGANRGVYRLPTLNLRTCW